MKWMLPLGFVHDSHMQFEMVMKLTRVDTQVGNGVNSTDTWCMVMQ